MFITFLQKNKYIILKILLVILLILILYICISNIEYYQNVEPVSNTNNSNGKSDVNNNIIYCFWTGNNKMSDSRLECLNNLRIVSECNVILITKDNLSNYILNDVPLHPAFNYLSETHKADYLRTYFMNFYGGGYSDIKKTTGSWVKSFNELKNSNNYWICGYKEINGGVAYSPNADKWEELIGNGAYICKPKTPLTEEWYNNMIHLLDTKLEKLKLNPSTNPQDSSESGSGYPIEWNEMLGRIFHNISYKYKEHLLNTLPICIFENYR
jgi:hypothetical protein